MILWTTDLHLTHCRNVQAWQQSYREAWEELDRPFRLDLGDIGTADCAEAWRWEMGFEATTIGNHDLYGSLFMPLGVRSVKLADDVMLIIADVPFGDAYGYQRSRMILNDWLHVGPLRDHYRFGMDILATKLRDLSVSIGTRLQKALSKTTARYIVVATHCPLFEEVSTHEGKPANQHGRPWFCNALVGDYVRQYAASRPEVRILCLAGHTHSYAEGWVEPNVLAITAGAEYGSPRWHVVNPVAVLRDGR